MAWNPRERRNIGRPNKRCTEEREVFTYTLKHVEAKIEVHRELEIYPIESIQFEHVVISLN